MLDRLADLYSIAGLPTEDANLRKRRDGVEAWAKQASVDQAIETVRLHRGVSGASATARDAFVSAFVNADSSFRTQNNGNEVTLLAGVAIAVFLKSADHARSDAAALAIAASRYRLSSGAGGIAELESLCDKYLADRAVAVREFSAIPVVERKRKTLGAIKELPGRLAADNADFTGVVTPLLQDIVSVVVEATSSVERVNLLHRESSDVLWWLFGGRSLFAKVPFEQICPASAPLVIACELAAHTRLSPGFHASDSFLQAALQHRRGAPLPVTSICAAAMALPVVVVNAIHNQARGDAVPDLTPVVRAVQLRAKHDEPHLWTPLAKKELDFAFDEPRPAIDLASQLYRELMLVRTAGGTDAE